MADDYSSFTKVDSQPKKNTGEIPVVGAAAEGFAAGLLPSGVFDYVPAAMAWTVGKVRGDNYSFKEVLDAARQRTKDVREGSPVAYGTGQVGGMIYGGTRLLAPAIQGATPIIASGLSRLAGSAAPAAARIEPTLTAAAPQIAQVTNSARSYVAPWATKAAPWIAAPAVMGTEGAIGGAAESDGDLGQTAKHAGYGTLAGVGSKFLDPLVKSSERGFIKSQREIAKQKADAEAAKIILRGGKIDAKGWGKLYDNQLREIVVDTNIKNLPLITLRKLGSEAASAVVPGAVGAGSGAAVAALNDKDPVTGAQIGAAGAIAMTKLRMLGEASDAVKTWSGRMATKNPKIGPIGAAGAKIVTDVSAKQARPEMKQDSYSDYEKDDYSGFTKVD